MIAVISSTYSRPCGCRDVHIIICRQEHRLFVFMCFFCFNSANSFTVTRILIYSPSDSAGVVVGGAGVTGSGGRSQGAVGGGGTERPSARPAARSNGEGSLQQRLLKSSKSIAHAVTPPRPCRTAHSTYINKTNIRCFS